MHEHLILARQRSAAASRTHRILRLLSELAPINDSQRRSLIEAVNNVPAQEPTDKERSRGSA